MGQHCELQRPGVPPLPILPITPRACLPGQKTSDVPHLCLGSMLATIYMLGLYCRQSLGTEKQNLSLSVWPVPGSLWKRERHTRIWVPLWQEVKLTLALPPTQPSHKSSHLILKLSAAEHKVCPPAKIAHIRQVGQQFSHLCKYLHNILRSYLSPAKPKIHYLALYKKKSLLTLNQEGSMESWRAGKK